MTDRLEKPLVRLLSNAYCALCPRLSPERSHSDHPKTITAVDSSSTAPISHSPTLKVGLPCSNSERLEYLNSMSHSSHENPPEFTVYARLDPIGNGGLDVGEVGLGKVDAEFEDAELGGRYVFAEICIRLA